MIGYVGEIDAPWLIEVIAERFDYSAINAMTEYSLIYGGAVRDALAGVPLEGDLDIVVFPAALSATTRVFDNSSKWVRATNGAINEPPRSEEFGIVSIERTAPYPGHLNIQDVITYRTVTDATVQIVVSSRDASYRPSREFSMEPLYNVIRNVDIVCCGLAMDREGKIFEILEGAHQDCQNRILRFNEKIIETMSIDNLIRRVQKLEKRGWKSEINLDSVKERHEKVKPKEEVKLSVNKSIDIDEPWIEGAIINTGGSGKWLRDPSGLKPTPEEQTEPEVGEPSEPPEGVEDGLNPGAQREYELNILRKKRKQMEKKELYLRAYNAELDKRNLGSFGSLEAKPKAKPKPVMVSWEDAPRAYKNTSPRAYRGKVNNGAHRGVDILGIAKDITSNWSDPALADDIARNFSSWDRHRIHVEDTLDGMRVRGEANSGEYIIIYTYLKRITKIMHEMYEKRSLWPKNINAKTKTAKTISGRIKNKKITPKNIIANSRYYNEET